VERIITEERRFVVISIYMKADGVRDAPRARRGIFMHVFLTVAVSWRFLFADVGRWINQASSKSRRLKHEYRELSASWRSNGKTTSVTR
jgi:hypothetical protein